MSLCVILDEEDVVGLNVLKISKEKNNLLIVLCPDWGMENHSQDNAVSLSHTWLYGVCFPLALALPFEGADKY